MEEAAADRLKAQLTRRVDKSELAHGYHSETQIPIRNPDFMQNILIFKGWLIFVFLSQNSILSKQNISVSWMWPTTSHLWAPAPFLPFGWSQRIIGMAPSSNSQRNLFPYRLFSISSGHIYSLACGPTFYLYSTPVSASIMTERSPLTFFLL